MTSSDKSPSSCSSGSSEYTMDHKEETGEEIREAIQQETENLLLHHLQTRDWSAIPTGILNVISQKVGYICDFIRFQAVCKAWLLNSSIADLGPQFPWLLKQRNRPYEATLTFYSMETKKEHSIVVPEASGKFFSGSLNGYLVAQTSQINVHSPNQAAKLTVLNPLNNHVISLPSNNLDFNSGLLQTRVGANYILQFSVLRDSIHALTVNGVTEYNWKEIPLGVTNYSRRHFSLGHILISVDKFLGTTRVTNLTTGTLEYEFQGFVHQEGTEHMVMISNEIIRFFRDIGGVIHLHRLDVLSRSWLKVERTGSKALFVDHISCYVLEAFAGCGIRENTVYHLEPGFDLRILNLETNATESYRLPWAEPMSWYIPNVNRLQD